MFFSSCVKSGILAEGCLYMHPIIIFGLLLLTVIFAQQDSTGGIVNFISALGMAFRLLDMLRAAPPAAVSESV